MKILAFILALAFSSAALSGCACRVITCTVRRQPLQEDSSHRVLREAVGRSDNLRPAVKSAG